MKSEFSGPKICINNKNVFKLETLTGSGDKVFLFQNDWTQFGGGTNVWQIAGGQQYQLKSDTCWMFSNSAGEYETRNKCLNELNI